MTCTFKGQCPNIPPAMMHTSIAAGKCERCEHNGNKKMSRGRSRKR